MSQVAGASEYTGMASMVGIARYWTKMELGEKWCSISKCMFTNPWCFMGIWPWWHHQIEHFPLYWPFARRIHWSLVVPLTHRLVMRSFDAFFDLHLNQWLSKPSRRRWFEMPLCPLWRHCNAVPKSSKDLQSMHRGDDNLKYFSSQNFRNGQNLLTEMHILCGVTFPEIKSWYHFIYAM